MDAPPLPVPYAAVGTQRALASPIGLPSRLTSASWMLVLRMPEEVRRNLIMLYSVIDLHCYILARLFFKRPLATRRAEVVRLPAILAGVARAGDLDGHPAHRVNGLDRRRNQPPCTWGMLMLGGLGVGGVVVAGMGEPTPAQLHGFGQDAQGNFFRGDRADVEAGWEL